MKYIILSLVVFVIASFASNNGQKTSANRANDTVTNVTEPIDTLRESENQQDSLGSGSLNDIRFKNFTDKDWIDNGYIRAYRKHLDDYLAGKIEDESLDPYKEKIRGKFVIGDSQPFILGGLFLSVVFFDNPEYILSVWIYSDVVDGVVTDYSVRSTKLVDDNSEFTKDAILKFLKEHPEHKLW